MSDPIIVIVVASGIGLILAGWIYVIWSLDQAGKDWEKEDRK